jgi:hypothetical protein
MPAEASEAAQRPLRIRRWRELGTDPPGVSARFDEAKDRIEIELADTLVVAIGRVRELDVADDVERGAEAPGNIAFVDLHVVEQHAARHRFPGQPEGHPVQRTCSRAAAKPDDVEFHQWRYLRAHCLATSSHLGHDRAATGASQAW